MQDFKFTVSDLVIAVACLQIEVREPFSQAGRQNLVAADMNWLYFFSWKHSGKKSYAEKLWLLHQGFWSNTFCEVVCLSSCFNLEDGKLLTGLFTFNRLWLSYFTIK